MATSLNILEIYVSDKVRDVVDAERDCAVKDMELRDILFRSVVDEYGLSTSCSKLVRINEITTNEWHEILGRAWYPSIYRDENGNIFPHKILKHFDWRNNPFVLLHKENMKKPKVDSLIEVLYKTKNLAKKINNSVSIDLFDKNLNVNFHVTKQKTYIIEFRQNGTTLPMTHAHIKKMLENKKL